MPLPDDMGACIRMMRKEKPGMDKKQMMAMCLGASKKKSKKMAPPKEMPAGM